MGMKFGGLTALVAASFVAATSCDTAGDDNIRKKIEFSEAYTYKILLDEVTPERVNLSWRQIKTGLNFPSYQTITIRGETYAVFKAHINTDRPYLFIADMEKEALFGRELFDGRTPPEIQSIGIAGKTVLVRYSHEKTELIDLGNKRAVGVLATKKMVVSPSGHNVAYVMSYGRLESLCVARTSRVLWAMDDSFKQPCVRRSRGPDAINLRIDDHDSLHYKVRKERWWSKSKKPIYITKKLDFRRKM